MKRSAALLLALLLALALFAGCSETSSTTATPTPSAAGTPGQSATPREDTDDSDPHDLLEDIPDYKSSDLLGDLAVPGDVPPSKLPLSDGATVSIWTTGLNAATGMTDYGDGEMWKEYERRLGVEFEFFMGASTNSTEVFLLHIMSEDYADIMGYTQYYVGGIDKAVDDEVFVDLRDYTDYMPHYMAVINYSDSTRIDAHTDSGRMGHFCNITYNSRPMYINGMVYRQDIFDNMGWNGGVLPETFDEWEDMLIHLRDNMNMPGAMSLDSMGVETFNSAMLRGLGLTKDYILRDGEVEYARIAPEFRTYLEYMNSWYTQNLIHQDFYSRPQGDQYNVMVELCAGRDEVFVLNGWTAFAGSFYQRNGVAINPDFFIAAIKDPVLNEGEKPMSSMITQDLVRVTSNNGWAVTTNAADTLLCVRILDYMYSTEGALLSSYGPWLGDGPDDLDATYYYTEDGHPMVTNLLANNPDGLAMDICFQKYAWHLAAPYLIWDRESDIYTDDMALTIDVWGDCVTNMNGKSVLPSNYSTTSDEGSEISALMGDIETYVNEMTVKFIVGEVPMSEYDAYVAQIESMNIDRVCELIQQAVDRYYSRGQ